MLMKLFRISNQELAALLQVDITLVSKWRSGARNMNANPIYVSRLCTCVTERDRQDNYRLCRHLLSGWCTPDENCTGEEIAAALADWLCGRQGADSADPLMPEIVNSRSFSRIDQMYRWEGNAGRREAVRLLHRCAGLMEEQAEIISYSTQENDWFVEDRAFLKEWATTVRAYCDAGNLIKVIHPLNRNYSELASSMVRWLPLHITCGVKGIS